MLGRRDLPRNPRTARDVLMLEKLYGPRLVHWDRQGRWIQLDRFYLLSSRYRFKQQATYVVVMVPEDYGERSGMGAGLEEFYIHRDVRIIRNGRAEEPPHSFVTTDRRGGAAVALLHRYVCVHIDWDPGRDTVLTSLKTLALFLSDPWAFRRKGA